MSDTPNHHKMHQKQKDQRRRWNEIICRKLQSLEIKPKKVGDWGCGYGYFLNRSFEIFNLDEGRGFDGDYIDRAFFDGDEKTLHATDLSQDFPIYPCDLAACLEVAEHLPPAQATQIVDHLCASSNIVLFSAAIPHQEGLGHINCQYPSYWAKKFLDNNFIAVDALRPSFWSNPQQAAWFRQNILLFIEVKTLMTQYQHLIPFIARMDHLDFVHPVFWESMQGKTPA
jgi:hypothetical protein